MPFILWLILEQVTDRERSGAVRRNRGAAEGVRARPEGARSPEGGVSNRCPGAHFRPIQTYIKIILYTICLIRTKRDEVSRMESREPTGHADKGEGDRPDGQPREVR